MATARSEDLVIRAAEPGDDAQVVALLRASLNKADDPHYEAFLAWKHRHNVFGQSPAWVALHDDQVVGYRTFLRWGFLDAEGREVRAVRAVDTATAPSYRGLGIFRTLTLQGVAELTMAGDAFIFNTPNAKSRPGYLKMGWSHLRRLPVGVLPASPGALRRMVTARAPAAIWSEQTEVGLDASGALADRRFAEALLQYAPNKGLRTDRSPEYLVWRTSFAPLHYRLLLANDDDPARGGIIFRLRRRGDAVEAAVIEQLVPDWTTGVGLLRRLLRQTGADYAIGLRTGSSWAGLRPGPSAGLIPLPKQGPLLAARPLAASPPPAKAWTLTLGDIELF